jgi:hypothetical protein
MAYLDIKYEQKLERVTIDGLRHYKIPNVEGVYYKSMTSVLGQEASKQKGLDAWRDKIGHKEAALITHNAAELGTGVHLMAEQYITGQKLTGNPLEIGRFRNLQRIIDEQIGEVWAVEAMMYSNYLKLAGTTDLIGLFNSIASIIDFKTSRKEKKLEWIDSYFMQAAGYAVMWKEMCPDAPMPRQLVILISVENAPPQIFVQPVGPWVKKLKEYLMEYHLDFSLNK